MSALFRRPSVPPPMILAFFAFESDVVDVSARERFHKPQRRSFQSPAGWITGLTERPEEYSNSGGDHSNNGEHRDGCLSNQTGVRLCTQEQPQASICHARGIATGSTHHRTGRNGHVAYGKWPGGISQSYSKDAKLSVVSAAYTSWRCDKDKPRHKAGRQNHGSLASRSPGCGEEGV